ncbi:MAG: hypothetical protein PHO27_12945 [Sulfuricurvum sp.]|nr:hypothetical protein [Sulfuricurvum sp.]
MIDKIKEGSGVQAAFIVDGKKEVFNLAILARIGYDDPEDMEYGLINEAGSKYIKGIACGIETFFRCDYDIRPINENFFKTFRIITTDLEEIEQIVDEAQKVKEIKQKDRADMRRKWMDDFNSLPKTFLVGDSLLDTVLEFRRSDAVDDPHVGILKGNIGLFLKAKPDTKIYLSVYQSKDGKRLMAKKFSEEMNWFIPDVAKKIDPKIALSLLINRYKELKRMIKNA